MQSNYSMLLQSLSELAFYDSMLYLQFYNFMFSNSTSSYLEPCFFHDYISDVVLSSHSKVLESKKESTAFEKPPFCKFKK